MEIERSPSCTTPAGDSNEALDSLQTLFLRVDRGVIAEVKVAVDDEQSVEAFWADGPTT